MQMVSSGLTLKLLERWNKPRTRLSCNSAQRRWKSVRCVSWQSITQSGDGIQTIFIAYGADTSSFMSNDNKEMFGVSGLQLVNEVRIKVTPVADATGNQTPNERDREIAELLE